MEIFDERELKKLYNPPANSSGEDNGQITIIGGSKLFHGAPILALKVASRIVDMVFFASPEPSVGRIAEKIKSKLMSFIWVPWVDVDKYIEKSDAILIGPGFMRYHREVKNSKFKIQNKLDNVGQETKKITEKLLQKFPQKQWVIDAGSLQVMDPEFIPKNAILTPNRKEFEMLFKFKIQNEKCKMTIQNSKLIKSLKENSRKYNCIIVLKLAQTIVCAPEKWVVVDGGNAGLTKGGTGDVLAGLTVALAAKNPAFLAASAASFVTKKAADELYKRVGVNYNADDLAKEIPVTLNNLLK